MVKTFSHHGEEVWIHLQSSQAPGDDKNSEHQCNGERDGLDVFHQFPPIASKDGSMKCEVEGSDGEENKSQRFIQSAMVIKNILRHRGEAARAPGCHVHPNAVEEGARWRKSNCHSSKPKSNTSDNKVDQADLPNRLGGMHDAREKPLVLAFARVKAESSTGTV